MEISEYNESADLSVFQGKEILKNMTDKLKKIAVIGGDMRSVIAAGMLKKCGYSISLFGFPVKKEVFANAAVDPECCQSFISQNPEYTEYLKLYGLNTEPDLQTALTDAYAVLLGLPATSDGRNVSMPFSELEVKFDSLIRLLHKNDVPYLIGGKIPETWISKANELNIKLFDYFAAGEFAVLNSVSTSEGAIEIAMRELPVTVWGSNCLVTGFGKIGKSLSRRLMSLGANVTVSARKKTDIALARTENLAAVNTGELKELFSGGYSPDVIFNTVPYEIFNKDTLASFSGEKPLLIDLASKPGGIDVASAGLLGFRVIWALGLPGKVAPVSAGKIIADIVGEHLLKDGD